MKKNEWFEEKFLDSLFQRVGACNPVWLSQKQTAVCINNMVVRTSVVQGSPADYYHHDDYFYEWRGRTVKLYYSSKNCCGRIEFFMNSEESSEWRAQVEAEKNSERAKHLEDLRHGRVKVVRGIDFDGLLKRKQGRIEMLETEYELTTDVMKEIEELKEEIAAMMEYKESKLETA